MTAIDIYNKLMQTGIISATGQIVFDMLNIQTIVKDSSIVGNVIQDWLRSFLNDQSIKYRLKSNTQEFPDFLLHPERDDIDLLEVKCFKNSPNFDIANFQAYARSLLNNPYRLDTKYLIFKYIDLHGGIIIQQIWLKNVWEICCNSERSPLKIQWKQGVPVNIRPAVWYSKKSEFKPFNTRQDFVIAIKKVLDTSSVSAGIQKDWFKKVSEKYKEQTGLSL
ncbi:MAG: NgoBV family restriction endonuclease [Pseudomonadota bacterium]